MTRLFVSTQKRKESDTNFTNGREFKTAVPNTRIRRRVAPRETISPFRPRAFPPARGWARVRGRVGLGRLSCKHLFRFRHSLLSNEVRFEIDSSVRFGREPFLCVGIQHPERN